MKRPKFLYSDRPSKHIERVMIVDALRRLERIAPLHEYTYVGFGGLEFADFSLVHRHLGIDRMISIERDTASADRYRFNCPYRGIELLFGLASDHLPLLDWSGLTIVWLDYESNLSHVELRDSSTVVRELQPGSVLLVTLNAMAPYGKRLETLRENVGDQRLPPGLTEDDLKPPWAFAGIQRQVLAEEIEGIADLRVPPARLRQFVNFWYRDDARMQTVGWVLSVPGMEKAIDESGIETLPTSRTEDDPLIIDLPVLTQREARHLNARLPLPTGEALAEDWLDLAVQEEYARFYRWYPVPA